MNVQPVKTARFGAGYGLLLTALHFSSQALANEVTSKTSVLSCQSRPGLEEHCPADTASGVVLKNATGTSACLLGKTWGYDEKGVWVKDGCGGDFIVQGDVPVDEAEAVSTEQTTQPESEEQLASKYGYGYFQPGNGFLIGRDDNGELSVGGYALLRYLNQMPGEQEFTDHNGNTQDVDARHDIFSHRVMVFLNGWLGDPKFNYSIVFWTVNATDQDALFANLSYSVNKHLNLFAGINGNPGSRTLFNSHPYWLGTDRVMADEFFRPFFTQGLWAAGEIVPGLKYSAMVGNNNSTLGVKAADLDRNFTSGASVWWMPTTHEFGPRGGFGDWEYHDSLATRFGLSAVTSPEQRYTEAEQESGNTSLKLADSLNVFATGALAPGVTVTNTDYEVYSMDAGMKYRGFFLQTELYHRTLSNFEADGALPVEEIVDTGFYIQSAFFPIPKVLEVYAATSQIYGDKDAGFGNSSEYLLGMNYYPFDSRNYRVNFQVIDVNHSPVDSTFGYYTGGQDGTTVSLATSIFF